ncbi:MAG: hypothetical protein Q9165_000803 [Trypethelium subeluteriae]
MLMPVNYVMLTVLAGIIGLVLSGFTFWHVYLAYTGQTTIESLEKTRYLSPIRKGLQHHINGPRNYVNGVPHPSYGQQLAEIHANALPGITRPEEGGDDDDDVTSSSSPATAALRSNYRDLELARERDRYQDYLDERDSEKLPNAFDLGWRRNLAHVFGERPLLWWLPVCNTTGDGWRWEASKKWLNARDDVSRERSRTRAGEGQQEHAVEERARLVNGSPRGRVQRGGGVNGSPRGARRVDDDHAYSSESVNDVSNWNDVPDDMLSSRRGR